MDIKGLARNLIPFPSAKDVSEARAARSKTDADNDRDGNGQSAGQEREKRKPTSEEVEKAVKHLEGLQGVKDNHLTVRAETANDITVIYIQDRDGKVVRRIPEADVLSLISTRERKSGNLLNKAL